ncbi:MAG: hypothetical protein JSV55_13470 [Deltaproteobacteria bacterium]|nr:MAG: hypothetical protein JSV55_13470 [Deltaproteobacteria bacterium]
MASLKIMATDSNSSGLIANGENGKTIMADFHQGGVVTTLHALYEPVRPEKYPTDLEGKLNELRYSYA